MGICVGELIEKLKQYPPYMDIYVHTRCAKDYGEVLRSVVEEMDGTLTLSSEDEIDELDPLETGEGADYSTVTLDYIGLLNDLKHRLTTLKK